MVIPYALWLGVPTLHNVEIPLHTVCSMTMSSSRRKNIFDPIEDNDDIYWKYNPFDVDSVDEMIDTPDHVSDHL